MTHVAQSHRNETLVGIAILLVLAGIGAGVFVRQFRLNPALLPYTVPPAARPALAASDSAPGAGLAVYRPDTLTVLGAPETFGPDTLSDKIDGKADLYLAAGFVSLRCQRFALAAAPAAWLEAFVYDMGGSRPAFAVYSGQRRAEAEPLALADFAYQTANALFLVRGKYYVELIASAASSPLREAILAFARNFIAQIPGAAQPLRELALFPTAHRQPGSVKLLSTDAFGCDRLDDVFIGTYQFGADTVTGFLSRRATAQEAANLAQAYATFLLANGGAKTGSVPSVPGAVVVNIMGTYEVIFARGKTLAGVHAAESKTAAAQLAAALEARLAEVSP